MPPKKNPKKLNGLQLRTLALAQVLARDEAATSRDEETGDVTIYHLPKAQGEQVQVGPYTVSARDVSGFGNPAVWTALMRKNLAVASPEGTVTITVEALDYDTGLGDKFLERSDP